MYPAATVASPGVIDHSYGDRFSLGEPDGTRSPRAGALSALLIAAGLKAPVRPRIRDELWVKLWGNMAFNPISALTTATLDVITGDPGSRTVARAMMLEGQAVAEALGIRFAIDVEKRIEGAAEVGRHKTSMLQDLQMGRPLEIEAILGAVVELAAWVDVAAADQPCDAGAGPAARRHAARRCRRRLDDVGTEIPLGPVDHRHRLHGDDRQPAIRLDAVRAADRPCASAGAAPPSRSPSPCSCCAKPGCCRWKAYVIDRIGPRS